MIGRVRGIVVHRAPGVVILEAGGLGYEVAITPRGLADLPPLGEEAVIHTHLHVREDHQALYGFLSEAERDIFRVLLGASGVGPKLAMAILATLPPAELRRAVGADDVAALEAVSGVGKRTAQKLILELRPRLELGDGELPTDGGGLAEVRAALEALGFGAPEIREALRDLAADTSTEELLQQALQSLGRT
ncbi:MAG: Holliday junction branch migration protein RuvA [Acidimicrobiia bacterium]|nr:Holliday junction branch migration protein RuvA [Acidimicrobiia bacterium]